MSTETLKKQYEEHLERNWTPSGQRYVDADILAIRMPSSIDLALKGQNLAPSVFTPGEEAYIRESLRI